MSRTFAPNRARVCANANAVLDFPSAARVLEISRFRGMPWSVANWRAARTD
jgi:hypothetical protein